MDLISYEDVTFSYFTEDENEQKIEYKVFEHFNLSIEKGSFVAVLGHNGSGKSTIAKLANGIEVPQGGQVLVDGIPTSDENRLFDIRRRVGMVFQNPDNQIVSSIVEEDVAFGVENLGLPSAECRRRVDEALHRVGMYEYRLKAPNKLSGGQKQRVAVAGIIAMRPQCIVFDEPTAMLDPSGRAEVMQIAKELNQRDGITVLFITHNMDEAVQADRVVVVDSGVIVKDGAPRDVFADVEGMKALGLDVPQSTELVHMLGLEDRADRTILNADECAAFLKTVLERK